MVDASTTVGSITGELDLDITAWVRKIDEAEAKAKGLEGLDVAVEITGENRKALDAIEEVDAEAKELEATPTRVRVEVDAAAAQAKLEETRAAAAKPIVQEIVVRTEDMSGFVPGTVRPVGSGAAPETAMLATERLTGANGDLVQSYLAAERATQLATTSYSAEAEAALNVAVAKVRSTDATKAAAAAEQAYVRLLDDEKASASAVSDAERVAVETRQKATEASADFRRATEEVAEAEQVVAAGGRDAADGIDQAGKSASGSEGRFQLLKLAILGLGPGLIPLAAGAVGITGALGGMGAAGVLAFLGIKREIAEGTQEGEQYSAMLSGLKGDAHELESTAAGGLLSGAGTAAAELQAAMPDLNREVGTFSGELGQILPTGLDAVVTMLERAEPLLDAGGQYLVRFVQGLDGFSHSSDFDSFVQTAVNDLPLVGETIDDTLHFVTRFLGAMGPYGNAILTLVDDGLKLGSVLAPIAPGVWAMVTALTALKVGGAALPFVTGLFASLGTTAEATAAEIGAVAVAEDVATDGLDLIPQAAAAGAGASMLAAAGIGVGVEGLSLAASQGSGKTTPGAAASSVDTSYSGFGAGTTKSKPSVNTSDTSYNGFGAGTTTPAIDSSAIAEQKAAAATKRLASYYSELASSIEAAYTPLEKAASAAQTSEGDYLSMKDAIAGVTDAVKTNGTALNSTTSAGRKNEEGVLAAVQAIDSYASSQSNGGKNASKFTAIQDTQTAALEKAMIQAGMSKSAAAAYIAKLLDIPKSKATVIELEDAAAAAKLATFKAKWDAMQSKVLTLGLFASTGSKNDSGQDVKGFGGMAAGGTAGLPGAANGVTAGYMGTVSGPGNAAADLAGIYRLANGEEVTSDKHGQATAFRPVLKAINSQSVRSMDDLAAFLGGGRRGSLTQKTVNVGGVHMHNPVAQDPVQSAENASQLIGAYASFG